MFLCNGRAKVMASLFRLYEGAIKDRLRTSQGAKFLVWTRLYQGTVAHLRTGRTKGLPNLDVRFGWQQLQQLHCFWCLLLPKSSTSTGFKHQKSEEKT
jgi:hypothetical protein